MCGMHSFAQNTFLGFLIMKAFTTCTELFKTCSGSGMRGGDYSVVFRALDRHMSIIRSGNGLGVLESQVIGYLSSVISSECT